MKASAMQPQSNLQIPDRQHYDVVLVGGAKLGSSVAWFLSRNSDFDGSILVVEKDPSYSDTSTARTNSCMRQQFSREINVRISQFAAEFVNNFQEYFADDTRVPPIYFQSYGYMFLANNEGDARILRENVNIQKRCGAATKLMTPDDIIRKYPFYNLEDIILGSHNRINEGYYDGNTVFEWWKRSSRDQGVEYLTNEVVGMKLNAAGTKVETISLKSGESIGCGQIVNTSGPRADRTAKMAGIDIPIEPRKRYSFIFDAQNKLDRDLPLTIDPSGVHVRSDGGYYLAGCAPDDDRPVEYDDFIQDHDIWEQKVWPVIANRIPQFAALKLVNSWVGHYAYNTFDQNAVLGPHHNVENFIFVNGFSGHGFQQAPAMGRGISELITYGEYRSLDLSAFDVNRILNNQPFAENAVI